jgi:hypothetical protein
MRKPWNLVVEGESLGGLSTPELRERRSRLMARVQDVESYLAGSLVEQSRRCGKKQCRCSSGELHGPYLYLSVGRVSGRRRRLVYIPAALSDLVTQKVATGASLQQMLGEISAINLELLARRELE